MANKVKIDKWHRRIWASADVSDIFDSEVLKEARQYLIDEAGMEPEEITDEMVDDLIYDWADINLDADKTNLDIETGGYIVAYADCGFWYGRRKGFKKIGTNVSDIFNQMHKYGCDRHDFYVDPYNVRYDGSHHDGQHHILFRMVESEEAANRLEDWFCNLDHEPTEADFRKKTRSIRKFPASVFGW